MVRGDGAGQQKFPSCAWSQRAGNDAAPQDTPWDSHIRLEAILLRIGPGRTQISKVFQSNSRGGKIMITLPWSVTILTGMPADAETLTQVTTQGALHLRLVLTMLAAHQNILKQSFRMIFTTLECRPHTSA